MTKPQWRWNIKTFVHFVFTLSSGDFNNKFSVRVLSGEPVLTGLHYVVVDIMESIVIKITWDSLSCWPITFWGRQAWALLSVHPKPLLNFFHVWPISSEHRLVPCKRAMSMACSLLLTAHETHPKQLKTNYVAYIISLAMQVNEILQLLCNIYLNRQTDVAFSWTSSLF